MFSREWRGVCLWVNFISAQPRSLLIAAERSEAAHYSWRHKDSPEFPRPSLLLGTMYSRNLDLFLSGCLSGCRNSGGISQSPSQFGKWGVRSNKILCCARMFFRHRSLRGFLQASACISENFWMRTIYRHEYYLTYTGKCGYISFCWYPSKRWTF